MYISKPDKKLDDIIRKPEKFKQKQLFSIQLNIKTVNKE